MSPFDVANSAFMAHDSQASLAPDLRTQPPRRWNVNVDGVVWLPRLIDKARAYDASTLGIYLYGQSPVDDSILRAAGVDYVTFLNLTRGASNDADVLAALERQAPGATARLRAWSAKPPPECRMFMAVADADEGFGTGVARLVTLIPQSAFQALIGFLRRFRPLQDDKRAT